MSLELVPPLLGVIGLGVACVIYAIIARRQVTHEKVASIGHQIHVGAMAFMRQEYRILFIFVAVLAVLIAFSDLGTDTMIAFLVGAACSAVAGYIGMFTATKANTRTTSAAHEEGASQALKTAFFGGSIMGLCVASMGLLGLGALYYFFIKFETIYHQARGFLQSPLSEQVRTKWMFNP